MKNKITDWLIIVGLVLWIFALILSVFGMCNKAEAKMIQSVQGQPVKPRPEMNNAVDILSQPESSGSKSGSWVAPKGNRVGTAEEWKAFQRIVGAKETGVFDWQTYQAVIKYNQLNK